MKNKVSLRNISMVMRQLGSTPQEKAQNINDSVDKAKEAVQLDIKDGTSWCKFTQSPVSSSDRESCVVTGTITGTMIQFTNFVIKTSFLPSSISTAAFTSNLRSYDEIYCR